jgi:hypothetical protein
LKFLQPPPGYRTFSLLVLILLLSFSLAGFGIWKQTDPFGLGGLISAIIIPVITGQAYKSVQSVRATNQRSKK